MNWDPFQREVLGELGHRLYRLRGNEVRAVPVATESPASAANVDPLWRALVRAAGTDALPQIELASLRRDPAAKRALWPRLRTLRGAARPR
jgi:hypothetical protein